MHSNSALLDTFHAVNSSSINFPSDSCYKRHILENNFLGITKTFCSNLKRKEGEKKVNHFSVKCSFSTGDSFSLASFIPVTTLEPVNSDKEAPLIWNDQDVEKKPEVIAGVDQTRQFHHRDLADEESQFASFRGVDIHYKKARPFDITLHEQKTIGLNGSLGLGTPTVLLHGFGSSEASWRKLLRPLASLLGAPVLAFDRPGFGLTQRVKPSEESLTEDYAMYNPYGMKFSVDATMRFGEMLRAPWRGKKVVLIGHSAGCQVALQVALENPENIAGLVLVAPSIIAPIFKLPSKNNYIVQHEMVASKHLNAIKDPILNFARGQQNLSETLKYSVQILRALFVFTLTKSAMFSFWFFERFIDVENRFAETVQRLASKAEVATRSSPLEHSLVELAIRLGSIVWIAALFLELQFILATLSFLSAVRKPVAYLWKASVKMVKSAFLFVLRSKLMLWVIHASINRFGRNAVRLAWHDSRLCDEGILDAYTKPLKCRNWDKALIEFMSASLNNPRLSASKLQEIKCPVLVVVGNDDKIFPPWNAKRLADDFPRSIFQVMPECGHVPQEENPSLLLSIIRNFMKTEVDDYVRSFW